MNFRSKTKGELIKELQELKQEYSSLKTSCSEGTSVKRINEQELRLIEEQFRSLFENIGEAILLTDPDGSIYAANPEACRIYDRSEEEICKLGRNGIVDLNDPRLSHAMDARKKTGKFKGELNQVRKDGIIFPAIFTSIVFRDTAGNERTCMIIHDITDSKNAEAALRESEARFRSLFDNSMLGISVADSEGNLVHANLAYAQMYGYESPEEMLNEVLNVCQLYADHQDRSEILQNLNENGIMGPREFEVVKRDRSRLFVLVTAREVRDSKGNLLYNQASHLDLTQRKNTEDELKKTKESLEKLNQHLLEVRENERSQIAMNLHDDLGQKLTALNLDLVFLKRRMGVQSQVVRKKLEDMSLMIKETIDSIKEISSFLRPAILFDLGLVSASVSLLKKIEKQSGIKCHFYYKPEEIDIDDSISLLLYRVLQESLTNIVRHSEASVAEIRLNIVSNKIEMQIADNGKGIAENEINSSTSMGILGIKERIRSVNGKVSIKGEKGTGTTIKISVPYKSKKNHD
jgi:PAS domain S-box-containing protein